MLDKLIGVIALLTLAAFLGVVIVFVPEIDLTIVLLFTIALAAFDFYWAEIRGNGK
jgi:hypothetical protein